ncbi:MAG: cell division protein SepF [Micrococcaceae bacterium]
MGAMRKAMEYLGLADSGDQYQIDEAYPETEAIDQIQPVQPHSRTGRVNVTMVPEVIPQQQPQTSAITAQQQQYTPQQRAVSQMQTTVHSQSPVAQQQASTVRHQQQTPVSSESSFDASPENRQAAGKDKVTSINKTMGDSAINRITTIHPRSYNDAKLIGESFRNNVPVIMNVSDMGDAEAKRLVDFSAGLVFGMHGTIERVTNKVFLLSPSYVEVITDEKPNVASGGANYSISNMN